MYHYVYQSIDNLYLTNNSSKDATKLYTFLKNKGYSQYLYKQNLICPIRYIVIFNSQSLANIFLRYNKIITFE